MTYLAPDKSYTNSFNMVLGESALVDVPEGRAALAQPDHDEDDGTPTQEDLEVRARLFRNYREAARRRELRLAKFTPQGWESPTLMEHRLARIKHAGIARMSRCKDTRRVSVAWIEPALGGFSGQGFKYAPALGEVAAGFAVTGVPPADPAFRA